MPLIGGGYVNQSDRPIVKNSTFTKIINGTSEMIIINRVKDTDEWTVVKGLYSIGFDIFNKYLKQFLVQYWVHMTAVISTTLLVYLLCKKGRQAFSSLRLSSLWCKTEPYPAHELSETIPAPSMFKRDSISLEIWIDLFETYARKFQPTIWKSLLCVLIDPELLKQLPIQPSTSYLELKNMLKLEVIRTNPSKRQDDDIVAAMEGFSKCYKLSEEGVEQFFKRFLSAAAKAENYREATLVSYFLRNLKDPSLEKLIRQSISLRDSLSDSNVTPPSLETIVSYAKSYEAGSFADEKPESNASEVTASQESFEAAINLISKNGKNFKPYLNNKQKQAAYNAAGKKSFNEKENSPSTAAKSPKDNVVLTIGVDDRDSSRIHGTALLNNTKISYLCDSGADDSILNRRGFEKLLAAGEIELKEYTGPSFNSASGKLPILGSVSIERFILDPEVPLYHHKIKVADLNCNKDCLIGMDIIQKIPRLQKYFSDLKQTINHFSRLNELDTESRNVFLLQKDESSSRYKQLEKTIKSELEKVAAKSFSDLKPRNNFTHKIDLIDPRIRPIKQKTRPVPFHLREKFKTFLNEQLAAGLIEPSSSPWSSPINIVGKKDGGIRVTQDYRLLNQQTIKDAYPLPVIEHILS
jgi:hypothetical protein